MIIIGAGAAGLAASDELCEEGLDVCLPEAMDFAGGRIATIRENFTLPVEGGAEFRVIKSELLNASGQARKVLNGPINDTVFFAGEAFTESDSP